MDRTAWMIVIVTIAACAGPARQTTTTTPDRTQARSDPTSDPVSTPTTTQSTPTPPPPPPTAGAGAQCLYVGTRSVRCYWTRAACDAQIAFNRESGLTDASECRATAEVHCFQYRRGELCLPTAAECENNHRPMDRHPEDHATPCAVKTAP